MVSVVHQSINLEWIHSTPLIRETALDEL